MRKDSLKTGDKFGELTVVKLARVSKRKDGGAGERVMLCECSCGNIVEVRTSNLKSGNTLSCGCVKSERATKSNLKRSGEIDDIEDDIAYSCKCGSTKFNVLKSKMIECVSCGEKVYISALFK